MSSVKVELIESPSSQPDHRPDPSVTIIVNNDDSDKEEQPATSKARSKLSTLFTKHSSSDDVVMLESGQRQRSGGDDSGIGISNIDESRDTAQYLTRSRLTRRTPKPNLSIKVPEHTRSNEILNSTTRGDDVVLSLGDLELEEFDEPAKVHTACRKTSDEHMV